MYNRLDDSNI